LLKSLRAQQVLHRPLVFVVFALQTTQLLALCLQRLLKLPALLLYAVALKAHQINLPPDDRLGSQQRQQLPVIQNAIDGAMAGQQALQRCLLPLETGEFPPQRLQLLLCAQYSLLTALLTELAERQQA
jgi:hypothetical protein